MSDNNNPQEDAKPEFVPLTELKMVSTQGRSVGALIIPNGDLVISGLDWGSGPKAHFGGDYEYSATVPAHLKDSVLLLLLGQRFEDFPPVREWLEAQGIPFQNWAWSG